MSNLDYVRDYYDVPACIGRGVVVNGKPGVIIKDMGNHIGVNFDDDKPGVARPCHPTWRVEYGEMRGVRRPTRAQQRYQDWKRSDSGLTFAEWLGIEA